MMELLSQNNYNISNITTTMNININNDSNDKGILGKISKKILIDMGGIVFLILLILFVCCIVIRNYYMRGHGTQPKNDFQFNRMLDNDNNDFHSL